MLVIKKYLIHLKLVIILQLFQQIIFRLRENLMISNKKYMILLLKDFLQFFIHPQLQKKQQGIQ